MIVVTVSVILASGVTVGVQLNRLDDAVEEGLGGVMNMYADGVASKVCHISSSVLILTSNTEILAQTLQSRGFMNRCSHCRERRKDTIWSHVQT